MNVNIVVFDCSPEPFDKDVVKDPATPIHTDSDIIVQQLLREVHRRKLDALIIVKNSWFPEPKCFLETFHAKRRIQRVAEPPRQDIAAKPIHYSHQITEPMCQLDIRDVSSPDLISPENLDAS